MHKLHNNYDLIHLVKLVTKGGIVFAIVHNAEKTP